MALLMNLPIFLIDLDDEIIMEAQEIVSKKLTTHVYTGLSNDLGNLFYRMMEIRKHV